MEHPQHPQHPQHHHQQQDSKDIDILSSLSQTDKKLLGLLPMFILIVIVVLRISWTLYKSFGQKTRNPQQRRVYVGSRPRQSLGPQEPTIYVSPSNLPPPPKYECMAPPSYEEVVGVHYPNYNMQPIVQPINTALAHTSQTNATSAVAAGSAPAADATTAEPLTSVTVTTDERRTSLSVAARS